MNIHTPDIERVKHAILLAEERGVSAKAKQRLQWILHYCERHFSVSDTCRQFGIPRMTLYRTLRRFDAEHPESLEDKSRRPHRVRSTELPHDVTAFVQECHARFPGLGRERISTLLHQEFGVALSPSTVERILARLPREVLEPAASAEPAPQIVVSVRKTMPFHWKAIVAGALLGNVTLLAAILFMLMLRGARPATVPASILSATSITDISDSLPTP